MRVTGFAAPAAARNLPQQVTALRSAPGAGRGGSGRALSRRTGDSGNLGRTERAGNSGHIISGPALNVIVLSTRRGNSLARTDSPGSINKLDLPFSPVSAAPVLYQYRTIPQRSNHGSGNIEWVPFAVVVR